jgi:hypothetical protein
MSIRSGRQVALLWAGALLLFLITAWASRALHPSHPVDRPSASYYVGLLGLLAIGLALVLTWRWVGQAGPRRAGRGRACKRCWWSAVCSGWPRWCSPSSSLSPAATLSRLRRSRSNQAPCSESSPG